MAYYRWKPYVPVARRRATAARKVKQLEKAGKKIEPVEIAGRNIAHTFWGKAWCSHLERLSDFANRLPRGRTYVRNGSVCHLAIAEGRIEAIVSGSELYDVVIDIEPLPAGKWKRLREQCTGKIGSLLELLQGGFSDQVMGVVTHREQGLFPNPGEIHMRCSCPDWAGLCKHLAAVLYGVGARLDQQPELLFRLRGVDSAELIAADLDPTGAAGRAGGGRRLQSDDLAGLFGVELDEAPEVPLEGSRKASPVPPRRRPERGEGRGGSPLAAPAAAEFVPSSDSIARLRQRLDLSKAQLARLVGVTAATVSNWEKANRELNLQQRPLFALRKVAGMSPEQAAERLEAAQRPRARRRVTWR